MYSIKKLHCCKSKFQEKQLFQHESEIFFRKIPIPCLKKYALSLESICITYTQTKQKEEWQELIFNLTEKGPLENHEKPSFENCVFDLILTIVRFLLLLLVKQQPKKQLKQGQNVQHDPFSKFYYVKGQSLERSCGLFPFDYDGSTSATRKYIGPSKGQLRWRREEVGRRKRTSPHG